MKSRDAQRWKAINILTTKQYNRREQNSTYQTDPNIGPVKVQTTHNQHNRQPIIPAIFPVVIPDGQNQETHGNLRPNLEPAALDPNESLAQQLRITGLFRVSGAVKEVNLMNIRLYAECHCHVPYFSVYYLENEYSINNNYCCIPPCNTSIKR